MFSSTPAIRRAPRTLFPSTGQTMVCARFSMLRRFMLTVTLEEAEETWTPQEEHGFSDADKGVILGTMASAHDVAKYILEQKGELDTWKLEKLVYYSQAWHLVWDSEPLFEEQIQAWANGPVIPVLFREHRGKFKMKSWPKGRIARLTRSQRESIDVVLKHYGKRSGFALRELTHKEPPWKDARKGVPAGAPSEKQITPGAIVSYYGSL